jgi:hypothetical protein
MFTINCWFVRLITYTFRPHWWCNGLKLAVFASSAYRSWVCAEFESTQQLVVIGIDYISSCQSNYHTIMTMMAPSHIQSIIKVTSFLFESDAPFLQIVFIFLVNFRHDITEILLKVALNTITLNLTLDLRESIEGENLPTLSCLLSHGTSMRNFTHHENFRQLLTYHLKCNRWCILIHDYDHLKFDLWRTINLIHNVFLTW